MENPEFTNNMQSLLGPDITIDSSDAYPLSYETFIDKMEGKRDSFDFTLLLFPLYSMLQIFIVMLFHKLVHFHVCSTTDYCSTVRNLRDHYTCFYIPSIQCIQVLEIRI